MIGVTGGDARAVALVRAAMARSVPGNLVGKDGDDDIRILAAPDRAAAEATAGWLTGGPRKLIVFGAVPEPLATRLGIVADGTLPDAGLADTAPAPIGGFSESNGAILYTGLAERLGGAAWRRPLKRFDYADEWNNHGYGGIGCGGGIFDLGPVARVGSGAELALVAGGGSHAALVDGDGYSALWFNRPVGPIDSFEWRLVETFLSDYRADALPVVPVLSELVAGHDMVVTVRLDCDEDIETARPLWEAYRARGVPLSLAIHTQQLEAGEPVPLLGEVLAGGGSVLSHSATHASWWGGDREAAAREVARSTELLLAATGVRPRHAVSPFHHTRDYAVAALEAAGYEGCIGGNIAADPAFNLARGGAMAGHGERFVVASQQCMLHGDCMLAKGDDPLAVYREAFGLAYATRSVFAFLDHPFSARYQYGWASEVQRIAAHMALLDHIEAVAKRPLYLSEDAAMDFLRRRAGVKAERVGGGFRFSLPAGALGLAVEYRGEVLPIADGEIVG